MEEENRIIELIAKWAGKEFPMKLEKNQTLEDLKAQLYSLTNVAPKRQKIMGLYKGKPEDSVSFPSQNDVNSF
jgi:hypothetical protein